MENTLIVSPWQFFTKWKNNLGKLDSGIKILIPGRRRTYKLEKTKDPY